MLRDRAEHSVNVFIARFVEHQAYFVSPLGDFLEIASHLTHEIDQRTDLRLGKRTPTARAPEFCRPKVIVGDQPMQQRSGLGRDVAAGGRSQLRGGPYRHQRSSISVAMGQ